MIRATRRHGSRPTLTFWLVVGIIAALAVTAVHAQDGYPPPTDPYVNDFAELLAAEDIVNIQSMFADLKDETGVEAVVVTINSIGDYGTGDETIESFATHLFNTWGIGDKEQNDGVLILVAVGDRQVRIELGVGYGNAYNSAMQEVIDEQMTPHFGRDDYSRGIYRGARAAIAELTGVWPQDLSPPTPRPTRKPTRAVPASQPRPRASSGGNGVHPGVILVVVFGAAAAAVYGLQQYMRYRKRRCSNCQTYMVRLDEVSDDVHLDSGQKVEELLQSVDYDIWKCPSCGKHTLHGYQRWLSRFKSCPQCRYRTLSVSSRTIKEPTYTSTGRKQITRDCRHCDYRNEGIVILPMLVRSDDDDDSFGSSSSGSSSGSSSSSSFGGGHSSGGGASGSW